MSIDMSLNESQLKERISGMFNDGIIENLTVDDSLMGLHLLKEEFKSKNYLKSEKNTISYFKALSNPHRLKIIKLIKNGIKCSCQLEFALELSQPTISHHLKILQQAKIISIKPKGKWRLISLNETPIIFWVLSQFTH